jgi:hypothetical protein
VGHYRERMHSLDLTASTPDGRVTGRLRGYCDVSLAFAPGAYDSLSTVELQGRTRTVLRLLMAAREEARRRALAEATNEPARPPQRPSHALAEEYAARVARLSAVGRSPDGLVEVGASGMSDFVVLVAPGARAHLDEQAYAARVTSAVHALVAEHRSLVQELKEEVYGDLVARLKREYLGVPTPH